MVSTHTAKRDWKRHFREIQGFPVGVPVVHMDNGGPMKGATLVATLQNLGVMSSYSRPSAAHAVLREHSVDISVFKPQCNIERGGTNLNDCGSGCQDVSRWRGMSEEAASALKKAADLAEKLGKTEIGTAQVLAGLVACKGSEISTFLHDRGLTEDCEECAASDPVGVPLSEVSRLVATAAIMHALSDLISHPQELAIMVVVTAQCKTELSITDAGGNHRIIIMIDSSGYIQVEVSTRDGHVFRVEDGWK